MPHPLAVLVAGPLKVVNTRLSEGLQDEERRFDRQDSCPQKSEALSQPLRLVKDVLAIRMSMKGAWSSPSSPSSHATEDPNKDSEATRRAARAAGKGVLGFRVQALVLLLTTNP